MSEMKKIEDHIQAKEGEIQKYERFVNEVSGHLAKEMEVIRSMKDSPAYLSISGWLHSRQCLSD